LRIELEDNGSEGMANRIINNIPAVVEFISNCKNDNKNVLVHCSAGESRSPSVVIGFLIHNLGGNLTLLEATTLVKRVRPRVQLHDHNIRKLITMEKNERGENSVNFDEMRNILDNFSGNM
jgi:protein-tyrosine phosphatase